MGLVTPLAMAQTKLQVNANTQLELFGVFDISVSSYRADGNGTGGCHESGRGYQRWNKQ